MSESAPTPCLSGCPPGTARRGAHGGRRARLHVVRALMGALTLALCAPSLPAAVRWDAMTSPQFAHYTVDTGLPLSALTAVAQDRDGFIWIGSQTGLLRFDGYRFRTYQNNPHDPGSLPANFVQTLFVDAAGHLWVGTANAGLARYDPTTDRFASYPVNGPNGTSAADVEAISDDGEGGLWVGTEGGLDHIASSTRSVVSYRHDASRRDSLPNDHIRALHRELSGRLLIGTSSGLAALDPGTNRFTSLTITDRAGAATQAVVDAFGEDALHRLWFGTTRHGVGMVDPRGVARLVALTGDGGRALSDQSVRGIIDGPDGRLILATYGAGLFTLDPSTLTAQQIRHSDCDQTSLLNDQTYGLLRDRSGLLWVPTEQGLSVTDPGQTAFQTIVADCTRSDRLAEANGLATFVDSRDRLWVGYHTSGVDVFGADGRRLATLHPRVDGSGAAGDQSVYAFAESADGTVWIGTTNGLYRVGARALRATAVPLESGHVGPNIQRLLADGTRLWVGSRSGLFLYQTRSRAWRSYAAGVPGGLSDGFVLAIVKRPDGKLWVGTRNGLNVFDPATGRTVPGSGAAPATAIFRHAFIVDLCSDRAARLWVATLDNGVFVLTARRSGDYQVRHLTEQDGLPALNIDALQADARGDVWVSTSNGLAVIDARTLAIRSYHRADGVRFGDYWAHASALTPEGDVIFGAVGGLTVVHPSLIAERHFEPQLLVSGVAVGGHPLAAAATSAATHEPAPIVVRPGANAFQVEFAATDYTAPQDLRYEYELEGYDTDWTAVDAAKRTAVYTNLAPGSYVLRVRGSNREGVYSPHVLRIPVRVEPAWYQSWFFRLAALALGVYLVVLLVNARTAHLRRMQLELEALVAERTEELRRSKQQIEEIAYLDAATGLPNRRLFADRFAYFRALAERNRSGFALLLVDLDRFKAINDTFGHAAGDAVLVATAQRLREATRAVDVVARLGGDEFAVLLDSTTEREVIELVCQRILQAFASAVSLERDSVTVGISIGSAVYPYDGSTQSALYRAADLALYEAKHAGRNTWRTYESDRHPGELESGAA